MADKNIGTVVAGTSIENSDGDVNGVEFTQVAKSTACTTNPDQDYMRMKTTLMCDKNIKGDGNA